MLITVAPADLLPGDRLAQPEGVPEPVIDRLGEVVDEPDLGRCQQVYIVGEDQPREFPASFELAVER